MLFLYGCQSWIIRTNSSSLHNEFTDICLMDYEIHAQNGAPCIDSLGIWDSYIETEMNLSGRLYFDDDKLKRWNH